MIKIKGGKVIIGDFIKNTNVYVNDGKIVKITDEDLTHDSIIDAVGKYVSPGFIDTHVHGGGGADFMDGGKEPMRLAARTHLKHGTTSICPTTLACPYEFLKASLLDFKELSCESGVDGMPNLLGMHFEGPYFAKSQAGAQPPQYIYPPKKAEYDELLSIAEGAIVKWSFAPELPGSVEFCDTLVRYGVLPSVAHTDGTYEDVLRVYEHGARSLTHFYSGMQSITRKDGYRVPGVVEAGYLIDDLWCEIIADGDHLPPVLLKMIYKMKGEGRMLLVTDAMRGATMPEGESVLGRLADGHRCFIENGVAKMPDRQAFAGSVATADRLVRTFVKNGIASLPSAVRMMTENPAKSLGLKAKGRIREGFDADIVIFDGDINVDTVMVGGKVYS